MNANSALQIETLCLENAIFCTQKLQWCSKVTAQNFALSRWKIVRARNGNSALKNGNSALRNWKNFPNVTDGKSLVRDFPRQIGNSAQFRAAAPKIRR